MERYLGERCYSDVLGAKNENEVRMWARVRPKFTRARKNATCKAR